MRWMIPGLFPLPPERCYFCKQGLFKKLKEIAADQGLAWIADGTNHDDVRDYTVPGRKACQEDRYPQPPAGSRTEQE